MAEKQYQRTRYGYTLVNDRIQENRAEQDVLAIIDRMTKAGHNAPEIADELNRRGYLTRAGTEWTGTNIRALWHRRGRPAPEKESGQPVSRF